jgi:hypothetical protein
LRAKNVFGGAETSYLKFFLVILFSMSVEKTFKTGSNNFLFLYAIQQYFFAKTFRAINFLIYELH